MKKINLKALSLTIGVLLLNSQPAMSNGNEGNKLNLGNDGACTLAPSEGRGKRCADDGKGGVFPAPLTSNESPQPKCGLECSANKLMAYFLDGFSS